MAAEAEYGPHLKRRFEPLITGIGPVEAGVRLAAELAAAAASGNVPDLVVSLGSAGSRVLEQTEVYQVAAVSYRDMDASALGFEKGVTPSPGTVPGEGLPAVIALPLRVPGIAEATLSTGANIVSGPAYDGIDADMVDMETFAVLRACQLFGVPLIGLRGISDGAADLRHIGNWREYLHVIDEKLATAVDRLKTALASGEILP
ncbi:MAG: 5'-methylthioadenosine/S-adenosylhomocysteine nucleosidase [Rhizobiaceae bacterium]|nr:MAG: 5'-methylthioadenosine/S-adenosylhomocysteine nucleosidase [Rhizobiaceae bacterium]